MQDYRLVQTAVIGDKNSDRPVILPMEPHELDRWRKAHPDYTYWCGLQLDGCGGELSDRRYTNKVCHFAHHPSAPVCRRTANGESSADHLFIKQGVRRLMDRRKLRGNVQTCDLGTGPGDAVDVHLAGSRRRLRFQLSAFEYRAWRRAADELAADGSDVDWILAADGPVTQQIVSRHGYCLRVRCETVGGERRVHIGAEARDRTVVWTPLEDCALTPSGIVTPHVEEIRLARPRPKPLAFTLQGGMVFALVPGATPPADSPFEAANRHLLVADVKPTDSRIARTLVSLPGDTDAPPVEHVYRVSDGARMLLNEVGGGWAVEADRYVRLNAHEAQRTGLWTPSPGERPGMVALAPASTVRAGGKTPEPTSARTGPSQATKKSAPKRVPLTRPQLVTVLRDTLAHHARRRASVTWEALVETVGPELGTYGTDGRISLLLEVDRPLREHVPVLSALIRERDAPLPYLSGVLSRLGVQYAGNSSQIERWAAAETERAFAAYGKPARTMPPRLMLSPERSAVRQQRGQESTPRRFAVGAADPRGTKAVITDTSSVKRVRVLVAQLKELVPFLGREAQKPATRAVSRAEAWLAYQDGVELPQKERRKLAIQNPEFVVSLLEYILRAAKGGPAPTRRLEAQKAEQQRTAESAVPEQRVAEPKAAVQDPVEQLTRQLIAVAAQQKTIPALLVDGGRARPDLQQRMEVLDGHIPDDVPVLSALVLGADGGPVPFFRDILRAAGLAVPRTDEALLMVWRREQERAHAAYANPSRELPPRLVPNS